MTSTEKLCHIKTLMDLRQEGRVSGPAVVIGLAIIESAGRDGRCFLTREDIGTRAGIRRVATISAKITELRKAGFMAVEWSCRINAYTFPMRDKITPPISKRSAKR